MTTYPLPTLGPTITAAGITIPSFADIYASYQASLQGIFGSDIYLAPDSQDGQAIAIMATAQNDFNNACVMLFNAFSPTYAQGTQLSSLVKLNGLLRMTPTPSLVPITVGGPAGTVITNGIVGDNLNLGTQWALPSTVTIPLSGSITVTAACTIAGAVLAAPGTLTNIINPQLGWQTATNPSSATAGAPVEDDAELRQRQAVSTSIPAQTVDSAMQGAILNLAGVQRALVYDNDTGSTDGNGVPAHSIAAVVFGGAVQDIVNAIGQKKTPGTGSYGTTSGTYVDPQGLANTINFIAGVSPTVSVAVFVAPLIGYVSSTATLISEAVAAFLNALGIGEDSYAGRLYSPANLSGDAATGATSLSQTQLDALSATYNLQSVYQARPEMATTAIVNTGGTSFTPTSATNYSAGISIRCQLDDQSWFSAAVTGVVSGVVSFSPAVPSPRNIPSGNLVYVAGDVVIAFDEAAAGNSADVTVVT